MPGCLEALTNAAGPVSRREALCHRLRLETAGVTGFEAVTPSATPDGSTLVSDLP